MTKTLTIVLAAMAVLTIFSCTKDTVVTTQPFTVDVDENPVNGQSLGTVDVSTDNEKEILYFLSSVSEPGSIAINSSTGELVVADASLFDFEVRTIIRGNYGAIVDGDSTTNSITVNILDVNETNPDDPIIWSGEKITFTKVDGADETDPANQDRITDKVIITRKVASGQIYNAVSESSADKNTSPAGTLWAEGTTADIESLNFQQFRPAVGQPQNVVGKDLVLRLVEENIFIDVKFTSWSQGQNKGGFAYERSTEQ